MIVPRVVTLPTGVAEFDIARDGTLVYVAESGTSGAPRSLVWVGRQGQETPIASPERPYSTVSLSPDAAQVALEIEDEHNDIWVWDFTRGVLTRVTTNPGLDECPVWTPDGRRLVFTSRSGGTFGALFWQPADGSGPAERLVEARHNQRASAVLRDGTGVLFSEGSGVLMLTLDTDRRVTTVTKSPPLSGSGVVSPDGRLLAYVGRDSASAPQVYLSPFPNAETARTQVSTEGGTQPRWSPDGRELFLIGPDGVLMSAPIRAAATSSVGVPAPVLSRAYYNAPGLYSRPTTYDVSPDGRSFLMLKTVTGANQTVEPATVVVVRNWLEEWRQRLPP